MPYVLRIDAGGAVHETEDPYSFGPALGELDVYLLAEGRHREIGRTLGAQLVSWRASAGVRFAVWAPNARRVSVVGDFNAWDGRVHPMRLRHEAGVWELFIPRLGAGARYKYEMVGPDGGAAATEGRSGGGQRRAAAGDRLGGAPTPRLRWRDADWLARAPARNAPDAPMSIYEVHAASWLPGSEAGAQLAGAGRPARALRAGHGLHPCRAHADHGASVRRLLGIPAARPVRADARASGRRTISPASSMRSTKPASASCSTGCRRISPPTRTGWPASTAPRSTSTPTPGRLPARLEHLHLQSRPHRGARLPDRQRAATGSSSSTPTGCAWMRWPRCSTATIAAGRANGCPTVTAGARTWRRSRFLQRTDGAAAPSAARARR